MSHNSTFWRVCDNSGVCHCDWRYTIVDCAEEKIARSVYTATAVVSGIFTVALSLILYYRIGLGTQKIIEMRNGFPRPRPIESMSLCGLLFNGIQTVHSVFMLTDTIPNPIFRAVSYECGLQLGYHCFALYLFGIAYALSESSRVIYSKWVKSQTLVNCLCVTSIMVPFLTTTPCATAAGIFAYQGNNNLASRFTKAQYSCWGVYCGYIGALLLFAGIRLLNLLNKYTHMQSNLKINTSKVKIGALKVKIIVLCGTLCMWVFALLLGLYGNFRDQIMESVVTNMLVAVLWLFSGPFACFFILIAIVLNPELATQLSSLSIMNSTDESPDSSSNGNIGSFELGLAKNPNSRASQFMATSLSSPADNLRISHDVIKRPDAAFYNLNESSTQVDKERSKYIEATERVRTPPPFHK